jgi:hypothetical protein
LGLAFAAVVWAADEGKATKEETKQQPTQAEGQKGPRTPGMRPGMPMRGAGPNMQGPGGMQQGFESMMKQRQEDHAKAVGELEEIKKIAESENATKTAEALQKMIDKKNADFKKAVDDIEKRQKERMEMIQKRQQEMEARNAGTPPVKPEGKAKEEKK